MTTITLSTQINQFLSKYDQVKMDELWAIQSQQVRDFLNNMVLSDEPSPIPDIECDEIIRILDRNGKGNTKDSQAVARAMVPQGAWRRMLNQFHSNKRLGYLVLDILKETEPDKKIALIDKLYEVNEGQKNNLTGPSGNTVSAFLAAYDPVNNISIISLKDRRALIDFLGLLVPFEWDKASVGAKIVISNKILLDGLRAAGLEGSARTLSVFCYSSEMKPLWKGEHKVKRPEKDVSVTVPAEDDDISSKLDIDSVSESMQMQALIAKLGTIMGFSIWLPRADRSRVLKAWSPQENLLDDLPLGYDSTTMKTIEQIDVLWLRKRTIVRAFEVEHTTSVYSGLLRMADLVALQPNINIKLHIVADESRRDKVMQEIQRPVFSLLEGRALSEMCTYLSYDSIKAISDLEHLAHLSDNVIEDYEENAISSDD